MVGKDRSRGHGEEDGHQMKTHVRIPRSLARLLTWASMRSGHDLTIAPGHCSAVGHTGGGSAVPGQVGEDAFSSDREDRYLRWSVIVGRKVEVSIRGSTPFPYCSGSRNRSRGKHRSRLAPFRVSFLLTSLCSTWSSKRGGVNGPEHLNSMMSSDDSVHVKYDLPYTRFQRPDRVWCLRFG